MASDKLRYGLEAMYKEIYNTRSVGYLATYKPLDSFGWEGWGEDKPEEPKINPLGEEKL